MGRKLRSRLLLLREWRSVVRKVASIVGELYPDAKVYLIGGVAEGRATVLSDVDLVVAFERSLSMEERAEALARIWESIEEEVPMYYPLEILILGASELSRIKGKKVRMQ